MRSEIARNKYKGADYVWMMCGRSNEIFDNELKK